MVKKLKTPHTLTLNPDLVRKLKKEAFQLGRSLSNYVEYILTKFMERDGHFHEAKTGEQYGRSSGSHAID